MIPKIIHYVWIGGTQLPPLAEECIASWKQHMPDWEYKRRDESNFDIAAAPLYVRQAYEARKFAFVSDYVRLWALEQYGGLYMDEDFKVYRPFDDLMDKYTAYAGYEGSKYQPVMLAHSAVSLLTSIACVDYRLSIDYYRRLKDRGIFPLTPNRASKKAIRKIKMLDTCPRLLLLLIFSKNHHLV